MSTRARHGNGVRGRGGIAGAGADCHGGTDSWVCYTFRVLRGFEESRHKADLDLKHLVGGFRCGTFRKSGREAGGGSKPTIDGIIESGLWYWG